MSFKAGDRVALRGLGVDDDGGDLGTVVSVRLSDDDADTALKVEWDHVKRGQTRFSTVYGDEVFIPSKNATRALGTPEFWKLSPRFRRA